MRKTRRGMIFCFTILFFLTIGICFFSVSNALGYFTKPTHPNLTSLAIELYNKSSDPDLTVEQVAWIEKGVIDEDYPPRWMNHFFEPLSNSGFKGLYPPARVWVQSPDLQKDEVLGDFSWPQAMNHYKNHDFELAWQALGHVLHIIQDLTVPAHTRDDAHPFGDSFEEFVKKDWEKLAVMIGEKTKSISNIPDINTAIIDLASFVNQYFYSDDTIASAEYKDIPIVQEKEEIAVNGKKYIYHYAALPDGQLYRLFVTDKEIGWTALLSGNSRRLLDQLVLSDYATHLLTKAVSYCAGMTSLFVQEADSASMPTLLYIKESVFTKANQYAGKVIKNLVDLWTKIRPSSSKFVQADTQQVLSVESGLRDEIAQEDSEEINMKEEVGEGDIASESIPDLPDIVGIVTNAGEERFDSIQEKAEQVQEQDDKSEIIQNKNTRHNVINEQEEFNTVLPVEDKPLSATIPLAVPVKNSTQEISLENEEEPADINNIVSEEYNQVEEATESQTNVIEPFDKIIVISEIGWAGTGKEKTSDEWIELYNNAGQEIDLSGWQLKIGDKLIKLTEKIDANDYYLLERTDDNTLPGVTADQFFTLAGGLHNDGEFLQLIAPNDFLVDEIDCRQGWFAGNNTEYYSMQRLNNLVNGNDTLNWQNSYGQRDVVGENDLVPLPVSEDMEEEIQEDIDEEDEETENIEEETSDGEKEIIGEWTQDEEITEDSNDSSPVTLSGEQFETELILKPGSNPYILSGTYVIPAGKILRIVPGVVIKAESNNSGFDVYGELVISGTKEQVVVMTSGRDHSFSDEELNVVFGVWDTEQPKDGDWHGVILRPGARAIVEFLQMRYAGFVSEHNSGAIHGESAELLIKDSLLTDNGAVFLFLISSSSTIIHTEMAKGITAIQANSGSLNVDDSTISQFTREAGPLDINQTKTKFNNLHWIENAFDGSVVRGELSADLVIPAGLPTLLSNIKIPEGISMTWSPGSQIYLPQTGFVEIFGQLIAEGMMDAPIFVEPFPTSTRWGYILFKNTSSSLHYVNFLGGNFLSRIPEERNGALVLENSKIRMDSCAVLDSRTPGNGILSMYSELELVNTVIGHSKEPGFDAIGIKAVGGSIKLDNPWFINLKYGIYGKYDDQHFLSTLNMERTGMENFVNVKESWQPKSWSTFEDDGGLLDLL